MKKHTQVYLNAMNYSTTDFIPCEVCNTQAVDIHHIKARGMGGSDKLDHIDNLMALCRVCHAEYGDVPSLRQLLQDIHSKQIKYRMRYAKKTPRYSQRG